jgi:glycosyltransferase involved in cell wall biosynthesis
VKRLVLVTQAVDPDHPVLATAVSKIGALATRVDELTVLALRARPAHLPANTRVATFGAPTQALRGARLGALLAREALLRRPAAVVAHMSPIYALIAARLRLPTLLWYTQWRTNPLLERAVDHVDLVLTADEASFPYRSPKVRAIGHGIDVARFACATPPGRARLRLLALGRYAEVKGYAALLEAMRGLDAELLIHGSTETEADTRHRAELVRQAPANVSIGGPVAPAEVPALLAGADALVSATRGGADKVVFEACAACVPAFAPAAAFAALLPNELRFDDDLGQKLRAFAATAAAERAELGRALRARVERSHSVEHWADEVVAAAGL